MAKTEKLFSKIMMIIFLALIILGFTIPGFINNSGTGTVQDQVEPRLCKTDADCYLTCDTQPLPVLCLQNLCQQNECGDSYFSYEQEDPIAFELEVRLSENSLNLVELANSRDLFVRFMDENKVEMYSPKLSLNIVLDKMKMILANNCLGINLEIYCSDQEHSLAVLINGEEATDPGLYIPNTGDEIKILYSVLG